MAKTPLAYALTGLAGGELPPAEFAAWEALDRRADEYRLLPLLHHLHGSANAVPEPIRASWAAAYRDSAMTALLQRRTLAQLASLLGAHRLQFLALKGAFLAWHAWPSPALRPLRDLDVLLPEDAILEAQRLLVENGWVQVEEPGYATFGARGWLARFKALPPLISPDGIALDLHARLWDEGGKAPSQPDGLMDRSIAPDAQPGLHFPDLVDQLMHLSVHACLHRFDGGPLMLADFAHFLRRANFDWGQVRQRAASEGWQPHLALCLAGAKRWSGLAAPWPEPLKDVPSELVENLPLLLAKPRASRDGDIAMAKAIDRRGGPGDTLRRILARRERHASMASYLGWIGREATGALRTTLGGRERLSLIAELDGYLTR